MQVTDNRCAFQEQDTIDQHLGVSHFVNRSLLDRFVQFFVSPIRAHTGMHHVLAYSGQLIRQQVTSLAG